MRPAHLSRWMRFACLWAAAGVLVTLPAATAEAVTVSPKRIKPEAPCLTPAAPDGVEPPCNPAMAPSPWPASHRAEHESGSSPYPAPAPGDVIDHSHTPLPGLAAATFPSFTGPDRAGRRVAWVTTNGAFSVSKTDLAGRVIDTWTESREGRSPTFPTDQTATNVYNAVDADGNYLLASGTSVAVFADAVAGDHASGVRLVKTFTLPAAAQCRGPDPIVGLTILPDGTVALGTKNGVVATVPRQPARMTAANVRSLRVDRRCDDRSVPTDQLEENSNSISADDRGGIYLATNRAQYRLDWNGRTLVKRWEAEYLRGRTAGAFTSSTRTPGTGASPDVVQAGPGSDRFVVITDGRPLMHLVYLWADDIPKDWKPIRPGASRRIACEAPVTFGTGAATTSSEQSVLTRGYASVLTNNTVPGEQLYQALPGLSRTLVNALIGPGGTGAKGIERIDWDPRTRTCRTRWARPDLSIPNAVPSMSSATGLIYGISTQGADWGLQGIDFQTGRLELFRPAGPSPTENSFFAMTTVGPDDSIWTGTPAGLSIYRARRPKPPPPLRCQDVTPVTVKRLRARPLAGRRVRVTARVSDRACGRAVAVRRVKLRAPGLRSRTVRVRKGRVAVTLRRGRGRTVRLVAADGGRNTTTARRRIRR